jgi:hypothetical protein
MVKNGFILHTQMRFVGKKMGVVVRIVHITGAFIDLLCYSVLVEKYFIDIDVQLIKVVRI